MNLFLITLDKCPKCGKYGVIDTIEDNYYEVRKCIKCGFILRRTLIKGLKEDFEFWKRWIEGDERK